MIKHIACLLLLGTVSTSASSKDIVINEADYVLYSRKKDANIVKIYEYIQKRNKDRLYIQKIEQPNNLGLAASFAYVLGDAPPTNIIIVEKSMKQPSGKVSLLIVINMFYQLPDELKTREAQQKLLKMNNASMPGAFGAQKIIHTGKFLIFKSVICLPTKDSLYPIENIESIIWNTIYGWKTYFEEMQKQLNLKADKTHKAYFERVSKARNKKQNTPNGK